MSDGREAHGSMPDRKQIKRCQKKEGKTRGREKKGMRERRRGNRGATRQKRRPDRRARHDPGFPRSFPAYCFPLRIRLRAPSSTLASASRRIYAFIRAGRRPHPRLTPEGAEVKRDREGSAGREGRGSPPSIIVVGV